MSSPVVWFEVMGSNTANLRQFYADLFGWSFADMPGMDYGMVNAAQSGIPGGVGAGPDGQGWVTFYVGVDDIEATIQQATARGAKVLMPPTRLPDTTIALIADPEGHAIGLSQS